MAAIKTKQDDLRKLMKERRENLHKSKIDSPFAKYNNLNQLTCTICNINIKHNNLWSAHVAGKTHKESVARQKKLSTAAKVPKEAVAIGVKRGIEQMEVSKRVKNDVFKVPLPVKEEPKSKSALLASYSSSDDDSDMEVEESSSASLPSKHNTVLPPNFFDNSAGSDNFPTESTPTEKTEKSPTASNNVETLPEGFFDDPVLDAKARNIEYKDPVEEEWERFQKTIAEESNVSKSIMEEDLEESTLERNIDQIDEQILQWERSQQLQSLADTVKSKAPKKERSGSDSGSGDEDLDDDDLLDWRSKGVKKS